jgi:hypothetical protein
MPVIVAPAVVETPGRVSLGAAGVVDRPPHATPKTI